MPTTTTISTLPTPDRPAGSRVGASLIKSFRTCPYQCWCNYLCPHPSSAGIGLEPPIFSPNLAIGFFVHQGIALHLQGEGVQLSQIIDFIEAEISSFEGPEIAEPQLIFDQTSVLLANYYKRWSNDDNLVVLADLTTGKLMVEWELEAPLGYLDYVVTSRLDAIVTYNASRAGYLRCSMEHKTVAATRFSRLLTSAETDIQFSIQLFLLNHHFPDYSPPWEVLLNCLVKKAAADKPQVRTDFVSRSQSELDKLRLDLARTLSHLDEATETFNTLTAAGLTPFEAAHQAYSKHGGYHCPDCDYRMICTNPDRAAAFAAPYLPRSTNQRSSS